AERSSQPKQRRSLGDRPQAVVCSSSKLQSSGLSTTRGDRISAIRRVGVNAFKAAATRRALLKSEQLAISVKLPSRPVVCESTTRQEKCQGLKLSRILIARYRSQIGSIYPSRE